jgi:hypothetical protein
MISLRAEFLRLTVENDFGAEIPPTTKKALVRKPGLVRLALLSAFVVYRVLHITSGVVSGTFGLVYLAFGLKLLTANSMANSLFGLADCVVNGTL